MLRASRILTLALLLPCAGCSAKKIVTITDDSTGVSLKYDCSRFVSQVKSGAETNVLLHKSNEVRVRANQENNMALLHSIHAAHDLHDILRLEELIVTDECAHQK